jgi:hypothetical protein
MYYSIPCLGAFVCRQSQIVCVAQVRQFLWRMRHRGVAHVVLDKGAFPAFTTAFVVTWNCPSMPIEHSIIAG